MAYAMLTTFILSRSMHIICLYLLQLAVGSTSYVCVHRETYPSSLKLTETCVDLTQQLKLTATFVDLTQQFGISLQLRIS